MPRNKSEKLPSCPEAHAYADACEAVLDGDKYPSFALSAWHAIPSRCKTPIDRSGPVDSRNWRRKRITFIRKTYAA